MVSESNDAHEGAADDEPVRLDVLARLAELSARVRPWSIEALWIAAAAVVVAMAVSFAGGWAESALLLRAFLPAILATGLLVGAPAAIGVTIASVMIAWWMFVPPYGQGAPLTRDELAGFLMFLLSATVTTAFALGCRLVLRRLHQTSMCNEVLVSELRHRGRNSFALIEVVVQKALADDVAGAARLLGRIRPILYTDDLLTGTDSRQVTVNELLRQAFAPFGDDRLVAHGPEVRIGPESARHCALMFHELVTNAVRHGALSAADGLVIVEWKNAERGIVLTWRESGGPALIASGGKGFGSQLISFCAAALGGSAQESFARDGFACTVRVGSDALAPNPAADGHNARRVRRDGGGPNRDVVRSAGHSSAKPRIFYPLGLRGRARGEDEARLRRIMVIVIALMLASWGALLIAASGVQIF